MSNNPQISPPSKRKRQGKNEALPCWIFMAGFCPGKCPWFFGCKICRQPGNWCQPQKVRKSFPGPGPESARHPSWDWPGQQRPVFVAVLLFLLISKTPKIQPKNKHMLIHVVIFRSWVVERSVEESGQVDFHPTVWDDLSTWMADSDSEQPRSRSPIQSRAREVQKIQVGQSGLAITAKAYCQLLPWRPRDGTPLVWIHFLMPLEFLELQNYLSVSFPCNRISTGASHVSCNLRWSSHVEPKTMYHGSWTTTDEFPFIGCYVPQLVQWYNMHVVFENTPYVGPHILTVNGQHIGAQAPCVLDLHLFIISKQKRSKSSKSVIKSPHFLSSSLKISQDLSPFC